MKLFLTLLLFNNLLAQRPTNGHVNLTKHLSLEEFETIKSFVLEEGDTQTYCMKVGNNPHYSFDGFEVYLHPEVGQQNMGCDPAISDFNRIVIRDLKGKELQYYTILIVRKGDTQNEQIALTHGEGMKENKVYLLSYDSDDLRLIERNTKTFLEVIRKEMATMNE